MGQLFSSLGEPNPDGSIAGRLYPKPLVLLIWLGAVVMAIGGTFSLSDRRLRVGAPEPAQARGAPQPAGEGHAPRDASARVRAGSRARRGGGPPRGGAPRDPAPTPRPGAGPP